VSLLLPPFFPFSFFNKHGRSLALAGYLNTVKSEKSAAIIVLILLAEAIVITILFQLYICFLLRYLAGRVGSFSQNNDIFKGGVLLNNYSFYLFTLNYSI